MAPAAAIDHDHHEQPDGRDAEEGEPVVHACASSRANRSRSRDTDSRSCQDCFAWSSICSVSRLSRPRISRSSCVRVSGSVLVVTASHAPITCALPLVPATPPTMPRQSPPSHTPPTRPTAQRWTDAAARPSHLHVPDRVRPLMHAGAEGFIHRRAHAVAWIIVPADHAAQSNLREPRRNVLGDMLAVVGTVDEDDGGQIDKTGSDGRERRQDARDGQFAITERPTQRGRPVGRGCHLPTGCVPAIEGIHAEDSIGRAQQSAVKSPHHHRRRRTSPIAAHFYPRPAGHPSRPHVRLVVQPGELVVGHPPGNVVDSVFLEARMPCHVCYPARSRYTATLKPASIPTTKPIT